MEQCPICFAELEVRDCAPCDDCGWNVPTEIEHLNEGRHTYTTYEIYRGFRLTLCDFCYVDFGSYKPEYFGFRNKEALRLFDFNFVKQLEDPEVIKDKFCPSCAARLSFLRFVARIRELNEAQNLED
jgi:hypothetical protein